VLLVGIVLLSAFLRLYRLDENPVAFTHDETALGYTAYSLLKTGTDIKGNFMPLAISPFGNWTLPLYSYIATLPIALFGLNEFATRLPSALAGIITTILLFRIAQILFKNNYLALVAALFFTLSPWSIYFSRTAYEVNIATTLFLGGLFAFLRFLDKKNAHNTLLIVASVLFGLTLFAYFSFVIFVPLFLASLFWIYKKQITKNKVFYIALGIFLLFFAVSVVSTATQSIQQLSNVSILNDENIIYNRADKFRGDETHESSFVSRIMHNKYTAVSYQIVQNYIASFSTSFLFDRGGESLLSNFIFFGNMYVVDFFLLILGFAGIFWFRAKQLTFFIPWILFGPIASSFTNGAPNSTRLYILLPVLILITTYGVSVLVELFKNYKKLSYLVAPVCILIFFINVAYFVDLYFVHLNYHHSRHLHYGYKQVVELALKYPTHDIVLRGPENFPFVSFLFYTKYDPQQYRREVQYSTKKRSDNFDLVESFGRYHFVDKIDRKNLMPKTVYIDDYGNNEKANLIRLPSGEPLFMYVVID